MLRSFVEFVIAVFIASTLSVILIYAFDEWYQDCERRRRAKWKARRGSRHHPARGGRYE